MQKVITFLKEVVEELSKVTWLAKKDVVRSTVAVSVVVIIVAIYVSIIDVGLTQILKSFLGGR